MLIQQGDVLISQVQALPRGARIVPATARGLILAEGEATGHAHVLQPEAAVQLYTLDEILYLINEGDHGVVVTHEEHGTVEVPRGVWQIGRVREYDYLANEAVLVRD